MVSVRAMIIGSLYFAAAVFPSTPCTDGAIAKSLATTPVTKISYSTTGGRSGNYESLEVAADSLFFVQARRGNEKTVKLKTAKDFWRQLTKAVNLRDFGKIKSDPGHALYDGIDVTLSIHSGGKTHTIVNGHEDTANYKRIRPFTSLLEKKLVELRKKIVW